MNFLTEYFEVLNENIGRKIQSAIGSRFHLWYVHILVIIKKIVFMCLSALWQGVYLLFLHFTDYNYIPWFNCLLQSSA